MDESTSGAETSAGPTLEESLGRAFDAGSSSSGEGAATTAETSAQSSTVSGEPAQAILEAPKHWSEGDRTLFGKAPREIQQRWIDREAETERGINAKFQEIAGFRREREQLDEMFGPMARDLELQGLSRTQLIQSMLGVQKFLLEKPAEALRWLASQYGVDPKTLAEAPASNPQFDSLNSRFQSLENQLKGFVTGQQQAELRSNLDRVEAFATAKDEKGQPLHPYFDEVAEDVLALMKGGLKDLDKAYAKAVRMNDAVWEKSQAAAAQAKRQQADAQRQADVDKAKRAGVTSSGSAANGTAKPKSLQESLEAAFAHLPG